MKKVVFGALKIIVPIALGVWLIHYSYAQLDEKQRGELFAAFEQAHLGWFVLCVLLGWLSHVSRAWRWRYLLEPLGHEVRFWSSYHAVMATPMNLFSGIKAGLRRLALIFLLVLPLAATAVEQRTFATPEAAVDALLAALKAKDEAALTAIFGDNSTRK